MFHGTIGVKPESDELSASNSEMSMLDSVSDRIEESTASGEVVATLGDASEASDAFKVRFDEGDDGTRVVDPDAGFDFDPGFEVLDMLLWADLGEAGGVWVTSCVPSPTRPIRY